MSKTPPLEEGLLMAMRALDNQIAREMQRDPAALERAGVLKWEPFTTRIERVCAFVLNSVGDDQIELDSILVLAQAMTKTLSIMIEDLESKGLGKVRSDYCLSAMENIARDANNGLTSLKPEVCS